MTLNADDIEQKRQERILIRQASVMIHHDELRGSRTTSRRACHGVLHVCRDASECVCACVLCLYRVCLYVCMRVYVCVCMCVCVRSEALI